MACLSTTAMNLESIRIISSSLCERLLYLILNTSLYFFFNPLTMLLISGFEDMESLVNFLAAAVMPFSAMNFPEHLPLLFDTFEATRFHCSRGPRWWARASLWFNALQYSLLLRHIFTLMPVSRIGMRIAEWIFLQFFISWLEHGPAKYAKLNWPRKIKNVYGSFDRRTSLNFVLSSSSRHYSQPLGTKRSETLHK